ncbi:MAG TPA: hypothetical protein VNS32_16410, partial [Flavisolibacter sp.]|nr:hypothetical protein [Flavisolibacter sp.]
MFEPKGWASKYFAGTKVYDWRKSALKNINFPIQTIPGFGYHSKTRTMKFLALIAAALLLSCGQNSADKKETKKTDTTQVQ